MKNSITSLLILLTLTTFAQTKLSVDKVKYKLSKDAAKNGDFVFSEASTDGKHVHSFYQYQARKKKIRGKSFIDVASYDIESKNITVETVPKGTDIITQFNLSPLTDDEVSGIMKSNATSNVPPTEVVEFSGIKLFAREGRLSGGIVGALEYSKTGEKVRLQEGPENFISPILVHPIDEDFSSYYHRINLNTGFFAKLANYAIVSKGSKAFVLGTVQGSLFAGIYNTAIMDYDDQGFVRISNACYEVIEHEVDPVNKQVHLLFTTDRTNPMVISATLDMKTGAVVEEKALTPALEGITNLKRHHLIEDGSDFYIANFTDVPKNNPNWGRNRLASLKLLKISDQNAWNNEYQLEELENKLISAPGESKKAKFDKKGTQGYVENILKVGDRLLVQGYFILGGGSARVGNRTVGSSGKKVTFIAQLNPSDGKMVAFYQYEELKLKKKDKNYISTATYGKKRPNLAPVILQVNDNEIVLTIREVVQSAGVHSVTSGNVKTTYRLTNDYGWIKLHKINLETRTVSKGVSLKGPKLNIAIHDKPIVLEDGTILIDAQNKIIPNQKTKHTKYIIQ